MELYHSRPLAMIRGKRRVRKAALEREATDISVPFCSSQVVSSQSIRLKLARSRGREKRTAEGVNPKAAVETSCSRIWIVLVANVLTKLPTPMKKSPNHRVCFSPISTRRGRKILRGAKNPPPVDDFAISSAFGGGM